MKNIIKRILLVVLIRKFNTTTIGSKTVKELWSSVLLGLLIHCLTRTYFIWNVLWRLLVYVSERHSCSLLGTGSGQWRRKLWKCGKSSSSSTPVCTVPTLKPRFYNVTHLMLGLTRSDGFANHNFIQYIPRYISSRQEFAIRQEKGLY